MEDHRSAIGDAGRSMARNFHEALGSPALLIAAGLFGAMLGSGSRLRGARILIIAQVVRIGRRLLRTITSSPSETPD